jgi:putative AbiEi antitoxin of type IV toxin-antitoxin system
LTPFSGSGSAETLRGRPGVATLAAVDLPMLGPGPLMRHRLAAAGVSDEEVRRLHRRGRLARIAPGAYLDPSDPRLRRPEDRYRLRVLVAASRLAVDAVVSHQSAAALHGLPLWNLPSAHLHATRARRSGAFRTGRLHMHTAPLAPEETVVVDGIAATSVARTAVDIARAMRFEEAVALLDAALHRRLATPAELDAVLDRMAGWPGIPAARRAVEFADPRAMSVGESRSRVGMARFGVVTPVLQWAVVGPGPRVLGTADFGWPEHGVVGEFDGVVKYGRLLRPGAVPADVVVAEKQREDRMRAVLRGFVRWGWADLDDFAAVAARLPR